VLDQAGKVPSPASDCDGLCGYRLWTAASYDDDVGPPLERELDSLGVITRGREDIMTPMVQVVDDLSKQCNMGRIA
jgi:hypothetical protein